VQAPCVAPRRQPWSPSALACLGMTKRKARRAYFYVAPSEARGPSALTHLR